jgi:hypothetical protein
LADVDVQKFIEKHVSLSRNHSCDPHRLTRLFSKLSRYDGTFVIPELINVILYLNFHQLTTKVWRGGCVWNSGTLACLSNVPLLITTISFAEGWIRGRQWGEEEHQGIKQQGTHDRCEGEEAWCHLLERLLSGSRTIHEGGNNA